MEIVLTIRRPNQPDIKEKIKKLVFKSSLGIHTLLFGHEPLFTSIEDGDIIFELVNETSLEPKTETIQIQNVGFLKFVNPNCDIWVL